MVTEKDMCSMLEYAENTIRPHLPEFCYLDDSGWGDDRFRIRIFEAVEPLKDHLVYENTFVYVEDEKWMSTLQEQVDAWIKEILEEL